MELLIVVGVVCIAIAGARWLVVRGVDNQERRERIRRRLGEL